MRPGLLHTRRGALAGFFRCTGRLSRHCRARSGSRTGSGCPGRCGHVPPHRLPRRRLVAAGYSSSVGQRRQPGCLRRSRLERIKAEGADRGTLTVKLPNHRRGGAGEGRGARVPLRCRADAREDTRLPGLVSDGVGLPSHIRSPRLASRIAWNGRQVLSACASSATRSYRVGDRHPDERIQARGVREGGHRVLLLDDLG